MRGCVLLLLAALLVASGCITGGSGDEDGGLEPATASGTGPEANGSANAWAENGSENATYLKNADYQQVHVHDYWPGNTTEKVLMDETVSTNTFFSVFYTTFSPLFQDPRTGVGVVWFSLPNGSFVPEGTGKLQVEVDATGALENGQMALAYQPANDANFTELDAQGALASWEIGVSPAMTDVPHAKSTRWEYRLEARGNGAVLDGEIAVRITAIKTRTIEAWPEHPDFWEGGTLTRLHLGTVNGTFDELDSRIVQFFLEGSEENVVRLPPGTIVPPETKVLLVKLWYARDTDPKNHANGDVTLLVKEGSSSSFYSWTGDDEVQEEPGFKMYAFPVGGSSWDSPYAETSDWAFQIYAPTGLRTPEGDASLTFGIAEAGSGNFTLDAAAYREVPPWLLGMMEGDESDRR